MEYKNLVHDFAVRTLKNLDAIEASIAHDPKAEVFEITQLINSMLGLLVFPRERFLESIPETSLDDLRSNGWPIPTMTGSPPHASNLRDLIRCLRNGISHCNLEFTSDGHELTGLRIWNCPQKSQTKNWEAEMGLRELREIVRKFISLILEFVK